MPRARNVFEAIHNGFEVDFVPRRNKHFVPTDAPAGTRGKIERLRKRAEMGLPLWHDDDRSDYEDCVGVVRPRD